MSTSKDHWDTMWHICNLAQLWSCKHVVLWCKSHCSIWNDRWTLMPWKIVLMHAFLCPFIRIMLGAKIHSVDICIYIGIHTGEWTALPHTVILKLIQYIHYLFCCHLLSIPFPLPPPPPSPPTTPTLSLLPLVASSLSCPSLNPLLPSQVIPCMIFIFANLPPVAESSPSARWLQREKVKIRGNARRGQTPDIWYSYASPSSPPTRSGIRSSKTRLLCQQVVQEMLYLPHLLWSKGIPHLQEDSGWGNHFRDCSRKWARSRKCDPGLYPAAGAIPRGFRSPGGAPIYHARHGDGGPIPAWHAGRPPSPARLRPARPGQIAPGAGRKALHRLRWSKGELS